MNSLVTKIDELIEKQSLLKHQFYVMWNEGMLTRESLSGYSKEYFQLVKEVPAFVGMIMECVSHDKDTIAANQKEEFEHIKPWMKFAASLGVSDSLVSDYRRRIEQELRALSFCEVEEARQFEIALRERVKTLVFAMTDKEVAV